MPTAAPNSRADASERLDAKSVQDMRTFLAQDKLSDEDRYHLDFTLGKALED